MVDSKALRVVVGEVEGAARVTPKAGVAIGAKEVVEAIMAKAERAKAVNFMVGWGGG